MKLLYKQMNDNIVINHVFIEEVIIVENVLMSAHNYIRVCFKLCNNLILLINAK